MSWNEYRHLSEDNADALVSPGQQQADAAPAAPLTVATLNRMAKSLLESNFPSVLVEGEISNLATPASGHWYFTLKDRKAQVRCAMFAGRNRRVSFQPENGQQLLIKGKLSLYEGRGDYQLIVDALDQAGDGALRRAFDLLKAKLLQEGLFATERKRPLPTAPAHIAVITSPSGAVIQDIMTVLRRRSPATIVTLIPVAVQGDRAADEIVHALALANKLAAEHHFDAIILGRGGGSLEDLQAFNEEAVARAIADSDLAVVSAVGHEVDFSIADFVADERAATPSAAAELLSSDQQATLNAVLVYEQRLRSLIRQRLNHHSQELFYLSSALQNPRQTLEAHAQSLDRLQARAQRALGATLTQQQQRLQQASRHLQALSPRRHIQQLASQRGQLAQRLHRACLAQVSAGQNRLAQVTRGLNLVSPLNTLSRGYSITWLDSSARTADSPPSPATEDKPVLRQSAAASQGDHLITRLEDGMVVSKVLATHSEGK